MTELPLITAWIAVILALSVLYRHSRRKPIFRPRFDHPQFLETWRSGRSLRNIMTRLGSARNCLWVAVDENSRRICPHFPFNLMFLPEIYGLEYAVPGGAVRSVKWRDGWLGLPLVRVVIEKSQALRKYSNFACGTPRRS